jgi:hypothetical protein
MVNGDSQKHQILTRKRNLNLKKKGYGRIIHNEIGIETIMHINAVAAYNHSLTSRLPAPKPPPESKEADRSSEARVDTSAREENSVRRLEKERLRDDIQASDNRQRQLAEAGNKSREATTANNEARRARIVDREV